MKKYDTEQFDLPNEEWRDLVHYPQTKGIYFISNLGRYKRIYKNGMTYYSLGCNMGRNYKRIDLRINGIRVGRPQIHDLVAEAFIRPFDHNIEVVHHLSEVKDQNNVQNLYIISSKQHSRQHHVGKQLSTESLLKRQNIKREKRLIDPDYGRPMKGRKMSPETIAKREQTKRQNKIKENKYV